MLFLKAMSTANKTYDGFVIPKNVGDLVAAPDWNPDPHVKIGGGLYGFPNGVGDIQLANLVMPAYGNSFFLAHQDNYIRWVVLESNGPFVDVGGAWRFETATVAFVSSITQPRVYGNNLNQYAGYIIDQYLQAQNPGNDPVYTGYVWSLPIMGARFDLVSDDTESPYYGFSGEIWRMEYYDGTLKQFVQKEYMFAQDTFVFGDACELVTDVVFTGDDRPARTWIFGRWADVSINYNKSYITVGDYSKAHCSLGDGGYQSTLTLGDSCNADVDKDCVVRGGNHNKIWDRGVQRQYQIDNSLIAQGPDIVVGYNCDIDLGDYSTLVTGHRSRVIGPAKHASITAGSGSYVKAGHSTMVRAGLGSVLEFFPDPNLPSNFVTCEVGVGDVRPDVFYHIDPSGGEVRDAAGTPVNLGSHEITPSAGSPQLYHENTSGPASIYHRIDEDNDDSVDAFLGAYDVKDWLVKS